MTAAPATTATADRAITRRARLVLVAVVTLTIATGVVAAPTPASAAVCPPALAQPFTDIPIDHPFCREIAQGKTEGWSNGYGDGTFRPHDAMTRQSAAAMLWQLAAAYNTDLDVLKPCTEDAFPDVPMDHPFCPYIRDAVLAGVFEGYGDGTFRPTQPITRQTAAAILYRFLEGPYLIIGCDSSPFSDVTWSNPFCEQILYMEYAGAIYGYPDGTFRPTEVVNRQHFVAMVSRISAWL
jgi:hypothetical protein